MPKKIVWTLLIVFVLLLALLQASASKLPSVLGVSYSNVIAQVPQTMDQVMSGIMDWTSNVRTYNLGPYSVDIHWTSDDAGPSWVKYWKHSGGSARFVGQNDRTTGHVVHLSGLTPNTTYDFVISRSPDGQVPNPYSRQRSFTTLADPRTLTQPLTRTLVGTSPSPSSPVIISPSSLRLSITPTPRTIVPVLPPLKIENVRYGNLASTSVIIYWTTNHDSSSKVQFYIGDNNPRSIGKIESVKDHKIKLDGLLPDSRYSYRVKSKDDAGQEQTSGVYYFRTPKHQTAASSTPQGSTPGSANEDASANQGGQSPNEPATLDEPVNSEPLSDQTGLTYDTPAGSEDWGFNSPSTSDSSPDEGSPSQASEANLQTEAPEEAENGALAALTKSLPAPISKAIGSSPLKPLFQGNTFRKTPFFVYILAILIILFLIKKVILRESVKNSKESVDSSEKVSYQNLLSRLKFNLKSITNCLPSVFHNKIFLVGAAIAVVFFILPQIVFLPLLLTPGSSNQSGGKSTDYYAEYLNYYTEVDYQAPPQEVISASFNCQKYSLLPDKSKKYLCKNIYQTDENKLKDEASAQNPDRIFLYGQDIYYDCPAQNLKAKEPVAECYKSAKFIDNWQIQKMREAFGVEFPPKKMYYYLTKTLEETKGLCSKMGTVSPEVGACLNPETNQIFSPAYNSNGSMYFGLVSGLFFEGGGEDEPTVKYKGQLFLPRNCYLTDNHEIIHVMNQVVWKNMPIWLEEGLIRLVQNTIRKQTCSPGMKVVQLMRIEGDQETFVSETFDPDSLDWEEPLSKGLTGLAEGSTCRQGIFLEIAKNIRDGGNAYLQSLYKTLGENRKADENSIAASIWKSAKEKAPVKESLLQHGCSI